MGGLRAVIRVGMIFALTLGASVAPAIACSPDQVQVGPACIDAYEASVWYVPATEKTLITKIRKGVVTLDDLTSAKAVAAGVVQLGMTWTDLSALCPINGNHCLDVYAASIPGVLPSAYLSWFQAAAIARNSLKRLPTNQEWQVAAFGTPDNRSCNMSNYIGNPVPTGSMPACVSDVGAFDMVGNIWEWVADWADRCAGSEYWPAYISDDYSCFGGPPDMGTPFAHLPSALHRGGAWDSGGAGVLEVGAFFTGGQLNTFGFRCAR